VNANVQPGCGGANPGNGCTVAYTVTLSPSTGPIPAAGQVRFELFDVSRLRGDSTNNCSVFDCSDPLDTAEDYFFWDADQAPDFFRNLGAPHQTLITRNAVTSATAVVRSRDYGGRAKLRASINIGGVQITARVAGTSQPYAQIPIDVCGSGFCGSESYANGIADAWESQYGRWFTKAEDNDKNVTDPTLYSGDGYSAHDEYRGFFVVSAGGSWEHVRTNPIVEKDVFFAEFYPGFANALYDILGANRYGTSGEFHNYRRVLGEVIEELTFGNILDGTRPHNRNSETGQGAYALVFINHNFGSGGACGTLGDTLRDDVGFANNGFPVRIDDAAIQACSQTTLFPYPSDVLRAQVIAHEAGHKMSRPHGTRGASFVSTGYSCCILPFPSITTDQWTLDASNSQWVYYWQNEYFWPVGATSFLPVLPEPLFLSSGPMSGMSVTQYAPLYRPSGGGYAIYRAQMSSPVSQPPTGTITTIISQRGYLMDHTPRLAVTDQGPPRMRLAQDWVFDPVADLPRLCIKVSCP
jgi:hypothetical protein